MRFETQTVRIGERIADVDWQYDFRQHFNNYCSNDEQRDKYCEESVKRLREIADAFAKDEPIYATTDGGWPRCGFGLVLDIGMYDGWPYWRPVPSVYTRGPLGGEWHSFSTITDIRRQT